MPGLWVPGRGAHRLELSQATTTSGGVTVTASATIHTKGNWATLIASTARPAYGIFVKLTGTATAATVTDVRVDIGDSTGGGAARIFIPDLLGGAAPASGATAGGLCWYYFPIFIPAGTTLEARCQALIASDTVLVAVDLVSEPLYPGQWFGSRVTAYGLGASVTKGTDVTSASNAYGTAVSLTASTTNPTRYLQVGIGQGSDTTLSTVRQMFRIQTGSTVLTEGLMTYCDSAENLGQVMANLVLSHLSYNLPAGVDLSIASMQVGTTNPILDYVLYGVD